MTKHSRITKASRRKGAILSLEMAIALPVLLLVVLAAVEYTFLLLGSQAITAAANVGARQAALPSTSAADVEDAVFDALASWRWARPQFLEVLVFVDGDPAGPGNELENAPSGTEVQVTVKLPSDQAAPDLLKIVPVLSIAGQELTSSFITRKE